MVTKLFLLQLLFIIHIFMEGDKISFIIAIIIVIIVAAVGYRFLSKAPEIPNTMVPPSAPAVQPAGDIAPPPQQGAVPKGLQITTLQDGTGEGAKSGDVVTVNYTGTLPDGKVFDSSIPRGEPFVFNLGTGQVIKGWDQGLIGMKVGEKRKLVISPELGYGNRGAGGGTIPPNATLIFEVEMLKIN